MATNEILSLETASEPMRRVVEALLDDLPVPPDAQEALTDDERREVAALARTANLASLTLHQPEPTSETEAKAWERAEKELARRRVIVSPSPAPSGESAEPRRSWLDRLLKRGRN